MNRCPRRVSKAGAKRSTVLTILTVLTQNFTPPQTACRVISRKQGGYKMWVQGIQNVSAKDTYCECKGYKMRVQI